MIRVLNALLLVLVATTGWADLGEEDVPAMTISFQSPSGADVSVSYQAALWDAEIFSMLQSTSQEEDIRQLRDYYNTYIMPRLARLRTNVTLKSDAFTLEPGIYRIGFIAQDERWTFVVANEEGVQAEIPFTWKTQPFETAHLTFLLVPGVSPDALQLVILYGPHTYSVGFLLAGEPKTLPDEEIPRYKLFFGGVRGEEVPSATEELQNDWRYRSLYRKPAPKARGTLGKPPERGTLR